MRFMERESKEDDDLISHAPDMILNLVYSCIKNLNINLIENVTNRKQIGFQNSVSKYRLVIGQGMYNVTSYELKHFSLTQYILSV